MKKPLIGITLDMQFSGDYSKFPWYAIRANYLKSIYEHGATPFPLFHEQKTIDSIINIIDGLIITGGDFDIDPKLYGKSNTGSRNIKSQRTTFEINIFNKFLKLNKPILGICGGLQLINIASGGSLIQDIETKIGSYINHEQINPRDETSHEIFLNNKSKLFNIIKEEKFFVNSAHHQSIDKVGESFDISARAKDKVIEAIEHKNHKWCIGVQWHPEFLITSCDNLLIDNFVSHTYSK